MKECVSVSVSEGLLVLDNNSNVNISSHVGQWSMVHYLRWDDSHPEQYRPRHNDSSVRSDRGYVPEPHGS